MEILRQKLQQMNKLTTTKGWTFVRAGGTSPWSRYIWGAASVLSSIRPSPTPTNNDDKCNRISGPQGFQRAQHYDIPNNNHS
eukprot:3546913-Amphidinium_carterae.1